MFMPRHTTALPQGTLRRSAQSLSLILATLLSLQLLSGSLAPAFPPGTSADIGAEAFFEPLQVCDSSGDFSGFLADHPWVSGADGTAAFFPEQGVCEPPVPGRYTEGCLFNVFRPPRTFHS